MKTKIEIPKACEPNFNSFEGDWYFCNNKKNKIRHNDVFVNKRGIIYMISYSYSGSEVEIINEIPKDFIKMNEENCVFIPALNSELKKVFNYPITYFIPSWIKVLNIDI